MSSAPTGYSGQCEYSTSNDQACISISTSDCACEIETPLALSARMSFVTTFSTAMGGTTGSIRASLSALLLLVVLPGMVTWTQRLLKINVLPSSEDHIPAVNFDLKWTEARCTIGS